MVTVTAPPEGIVDVLPDERCVRDGAESIASNSKLTVSIASHVGGFHGWTGPSGKTYSSSIVVKHGNIDKAMTINVNRTIRVPDNADTSALPPSLGLFPLYRVHDYAHKLPEELAQKGGIFFPMYQSEAMWLGFSAKRPFAVKIYVGGVNAVSGFPMTESDQTREKRAWMLRDGKPIQDYVVLPEQPWIDGIVSEDGKIRQFVAQPKGSGFSVEAQVTGEEKVGGIQVEIIPMKKHLPAELDIRFTDRENKVVTRTLKLEERGLGKESTWADVKAIIKDEFGVEPSEQQLSVYNAPARSVHVDFSDGVRLEDVTLPPNGATISVVHRPAVRYGGPVQRRMMGGGGGGGFSALSACAAPQAAPPPGMMAMGLARSHAAAPAPAKVKEMGLAAGGLIKQSINADPYPADIWDGEASVMLNLQIFDPASYRDVTGNPGPPTPATQQEYSNHGYPYYELWDEEKTGVKGDFDEVKSVAQLRKERALAAGEEPPADEESVPVRVVRIGAPRGQLATFKSTFKPLEVLRKELEHLVINEQSA